MLLLRVYFFRIEKKHMLTFNNFILLTRSACEEGSRKGLGENRVECCQTQEDFEI